MAQISIIEIDLGITISDLINEDVAGLVGEAQQELETAIAVAKKVAALKEQKQREAQESTDKTTNTMMNAYKLLEQAGNRGVPVDDILSTVSGVIPSASAFTLRLKKILKDEGNKYALIKQKLDGKQYYIFLPFNLEINKS